MMQSFGSLVGEFDTKLTQVLVRRIFSKIIILPLLAGTGFVLGALRDGTDATPVWRVWVIGGVLIALPVCIILYNIFFRKRYKAQVFQRGIALTRKPGGKVEEIDFARVVDCREIRWDHGLIFKTRELELVLQNPRSTRRFDGKSIAPIADFGTMVFTALDQYKGEEVL